MTIPQLPTDNLYKFLFLAGLSMMGFASVFYIQKYMEIRKNLDGLEFAMLNSNLNFYKDSTNIYFELNFLNELQKKDSTNLIRLENSKSDKLSKKDVENTRNGIEISDSELMKIKRITLNSQISNHIEDEKIEYQFTKIKEERNLLIGISILCFGFFIWGSVIARKGYISWRIKVQEPNDKKLKLELEKLLSQTD